MPHCEGIDCIGEHGGQSECHCWCDGCVAEDLAEEDRREDEARDRQVDDLTK